MGKRKQTAEISRRVPRCWLRVWLLVPGLVGFAIVVGAVSWILLPWENSASSAAQSQGGPRLAVDRDLIDFGNVAFNRMVKASFRLRNVGDKSLQLPASPPLEVFDGC